MSTATGRHATVPGRWRADQPAALQAAADGDLPAEALTPRDRRILMRALVAAGLTDRQIADHTRWTDYTTVRIRESLWLRPNPERSTHDA